MNILKEAMKKEAVGRLKTLVKKHGLNPIVLEKFRKNELYYSYLTACGFMGSVDTIHYDERYAQVVEAVEKEYGILVYHVIENYYAGFHSLALLYVGNYREDWPSEREFNDGYMAVYAYNFDIPEYSEFGSIGFEHYMGALVRVA